MLLLIKHPLPSIEGDLPGKRIVDPDLGMVIGRNRVHCGTVQPDTQRSRTGGGINAVQRKVVRRSMYRGNSTPRPILPPGRSHSG